MLVHPTHLLLSSATLSNEIFCCTFILIENHVICVPSTTADCKLFNNHRNKKVIGGNYNVLVHYKNASAPNPEGVILCNPFKWDILLFILIENLVVCVPSTTAKWISFCNHKNRKVVGGKHNVLVHYVDVRALDTTGAVLCNPLYEIFCGSFWSKI